MAHRGRHHADDALILALACGATVESAAQKAGVGVRTAHRRLSDPDFKRKLNEFRTDMVRRTASLLTAGATEAVKTLVSLQQGSTPPAVRLGAARALIELGVRLRESAELHERITALEAQVELNQTQA
jgi:hypothetical protein